MSDKMNVGYVAQLTPQGPMALTMGGQAALDAALAPHRELAKLRAEVEALRKDAKRYRWLQKTTAGAGFQWKSAGPDDSLDSAIDRAMAIEAVGAA